MKRKLSLLQLSADSLSFASLNTNAARGDLK